MSSLTLPDGRTLAYADRGVPGGTPVFFHHGMPGSRLFAGLLDDPASETGVRVVVPDRPGYGRSDPTEASLNDFRADVEALADHLDFGGFRAAGFSGGGPFALACGDIERVDRVALLSALAPGADTGLFGTLATRATRCSPSSSVSPMRSPE